MRCFWASATISLLAIPAMVQAAAPPILPGLWETAVTINSAEIPNAPPGVANMMRGHKTVVKRCATANDVAQGPQMMLKSSPSCQLKRYSMSGGHFSSEIICSQNGAKITAKSDGHFTATSFEATGTSEMSGPQQMRMSTTVSGRRLGDCH